MTMLLSRSGWRDPCEWDPARGRPNAGTLLSDGTWSCMQGCRNRADVIVGARAQWRLCESCAALPRFSRYRVRRPIERAGGDQ
jgi:hypothetical protein